MVEFAQQRRCAAGAELALACAHSYARAPAKVHQVLNVQLMYGIFDLTHSDAFTLAHQGVVYIVVFLDACCQGAMAAYGGALAKTVTFCRVALAGRVIL